MLDDADLMVRRNAALALVRFADASGRPELVGVLRPFTLRAPVSGTLSLRAQTGQQVGRGTLLARIAAQDGTNTEIRSPYAGRVTQSAHSDHSNVMAGDELLSVGPDPSQVWEALRALYLVGKPEDLRDINRFEGAENEISARVRQQAVLTAQAIRTRSEHSPIR
jgi:hypothetical protein